MNYRKNKRKGFRSFIKFLLAPILIVSLSCFIYPAGRRDGEAPLAARRSGPSDYSKSDKDMVVTFIDVGQGNSVLVESPTGQVMLYDSGGAPSWMNTTWDPGMELVVPYLKERGIEKVDYLVIGHAHGDHIGGMRAVVYNFEIGTVVDPGFDYASPIYETLLETVKNRDIDYMILREGDCENIDMGPEVNIRIMCPPEEYYFRGTNSDPNNNSLVIRVLYGDVSILLTGDIEQRAEQHLVRNFRNELDSNILQVPHHGSATSSSRAFLEQVQPEVAVIPVGERNMYGHPRAETLNSLSRAGAEIFRTDRDGNVVVYTDGQTFIVETDQ